MPRQFLSRTLQFAADVLFVASGSRRRELQRRERARAAAQLWFTPEERAAVEAMALLIVTPEANGPSLSDIERVGPSAVSVVSDRVRGSPERQTAYARGLVAFDALARRAHGTAFAQLPRDRQEGLFKHVESLDPSRSSATSLRGKVQRRLVALRRMADGSAAAIALLPIVIHDVLGAFYTSRLTWDWLGYDGPPLPEGYPDLEHPRAPRPTQQASEARANGSASPRAPAARVPSKTRTPEVVVIGSGAGGAVVAKELGEAGITVLVLEAGKRYDPARDYVTARQDFEFVGRDTFAPDDPRRDLYTTGPGNDGFALNRAKGVGGSTLKYVAMTPRFHESDFRVRSEDGVSDDWPITYQDLEPYYARVEYELGVSGPDGAASNPFDAPRCRPFPNPAHRWNLAGQAIKRGADKLGLHMVREPLAIPTRDWNGRRACIGAGSCHFGCSISAKSSMDVTYIPKAEATGRVEILPESTAFRIEVDKNGKARRVLYFDRDGREQAVDARAVVVAGNAVETPRLLLLSASRQFPDGLANSSGVVGRNFMEHLAVFAHGLFPERTDPWRGTPTGGMIQDYYETNSSNSFARGWTVLVTSNSHWPATVASRVPGWGVEHRNRVKTVFGHSVGLVSIGEQLPSLENRVTLDPIERDSFGLPVPLLINEARENDRAMLPAISGSLNMLLDAAGATDIWGNTWQPGGSSHYLGTCRMGSDPGTSVVDSWGRSHDVPNLFIADGSVFVTGAAVNPQLTISALATRAAEGIVKAFKDGEV